VTTELFSLALTVETL